MSVTQTSVAQVREYVRREYGSAPWVCVLATADTDGRPFGRCMVCREINDQGQLLFVSDRRSRKDDQLRERPACEVVFWLTKLNTQIRVRGSATVVGAESDPYLRQKWWDQLDARAVRIFSDGAGSDPETTPMPPAFELIVVTTSAVELDDYAARPAVHAAWTDGSE